ncbi:MAG: response regulator [Spirochaetota bacterium]
MEDLLVRLVSNWEIDLYARVSVPPEEGSIRLVRIAGFSRQESESLAHDRRIANICRRALKTGTPVVEANLHSDESETGSSGLSSCLAVPSNESSHHRTAILFGSRSPSAFDSSTADLLSHATDVVLAAALEGDSHATQLRRLVIQLTEAEDNERSRIATLLHDDLQQTLAGIKVHVDMAARRVEGDPYIAARLRSAVGLLEEAIERSRSLSHELSPPMLRVRGLVPALRVLASETEKMHHLRVAVIAPRSTVRLSELAKLVTYRAVQELLFNIVKHAGVDESTIEVENIEGGLRVVVRDHGDGFDVDSVLESEAPAGLGILSIRERLEAIGGSLAIESSPGAGSVFTIDLPPGAARARGLRRGADETLLADTNGRKTSVIVVDDHAVIRQGLVLLLNEEPDFEVVGEADSGESAIELVRHLRPDVAVMDLTMPGLHGDEATRAILQQAPGTRVIGLSMHSEDEARDRMLAAGAHAYLPKAGPSSDLVAAIRTASHSW